MSVKTTDKPVLPEATSGLLLLSMAILAMILANSPLANLYEQWIDASLFWINEVLMAIFFLGIGLELKHGFQEGLTEAALNPLPVTLSPGKKRSGFYRAALLPGWAALGGMLIPALIYFFLNHADPVAMQGWATPIATDIAFAVGMLSLFGRRVPPALKLFLLALAIFDDLGAVIVIALFYSQGIVYWPLLMAVVLVLLLALLNWYRIRSLIPYLLAGPLIWFCFLKAGLHPTLSGFVLALMLPSQGNTHPFSVHSLEQGLKPWIAYVIMPLFALANAGVSLHTVSLAVFTTPVVLGIIAGLFLGKQAGVTLFTWLAIRFGKLRLPAGTTWGMLYGVALLCGIGFTMSLFLGTLAFNGVGNHVTEVRLGVMTGSLLSGLAGILVLLAAFSISHRRIASQER